MKIIKTSINVFIFEFFTKVDNTYDYEFDRKEKRKKNHKSSLMKIFLLRSRRTQIIEIVHVTQKDYTNEFFMF